MIFVIFDIETFFPLLLFKEFRFIRCSSYDDATLSKCKLVSSFVYVKKQRMQNSESVTSNVTVARCL